MLNKYFLHTQLIGIRLFISFKFFLLTILFSRFLSMDYNIVCSFVVINEDLPMIELQSWRKLWRRIQIVGYSRFRPKSASQGFGFHRWSANANGFVCILLPQTCTRSIIQWSNTRQYLDMFICKKPNQYIHFDIRTTIWNGTLTWDGTANNPIG